ncbi:MAG: ribosomal protein S18-alanine N-acetyltransferase [Limnochordia bacterium]|jgi:ribosomal-protein-alanine N-acetyltransferase|nr:ribosomal protein S18-alanine N-acetyltransferase [Limnochordia bacterium]MDD2629250.1 ribosomal protein S18-alanine N-acetyltransferase [Limnochordia bacterium]MDD4518215.1 ribosomal protein S18-alanine N-acetyltransferase [Limnochordia bacterium]
MSFRNVIGLLGLEDVDELVAIEKASFPIPWSRESIVRELVYNSVASYVGYKLDGRLVGYAGIWIVEDEGHITNIAVYPEYRAQGIGSSLVEALIDLARRADVRIMSLEVRRSNQVAQSLYLKAGFQVVGVRKQYYSDNLEDALVMVKLLGDREANHG